ncbi:DUF397 domain-containing protein [Streptomyces iconiensis]|uniref:DUF397 domain-containing protein n=1 Tax=Streptomyces iconiensis TaxID=1384038 RepID=A0ABT7A5L9_9ACTN|nr:DUF397 domain-containing protein [Streptomyces iconiensis]MDJ1136642.1 DUF397 domain-containing protein [Streptomyces iconiensis]
MEAELNWHKSSYSGGQGDNCLEVAIEPLTTERTWHKSSHSGSGGDNCVEVAVRPGAAVLVRDSKDIGVSALRVSPAAWRAFAQAVGRSL